MPFFCKIHRAHRNVSDFGHKLIPFIFMLYKLPSNGLRLGNFSAAAGAAAAAAEPLSEVKRKTPGGPDSKKSHAEPC